MKKQRKPCLPRTRGFTLNVGVGAARRTVLPRTRGFTASPAHRPALLDVSSPYAGVHPWTPGSGGGPVSVFPLRGGSSVDGRENFTKHLCLPTGGACAPLHSVHHIAASRSPLADLSVMQ